MNRGIWLIPMVVGCLLTLTLGGLGAIMWYIGTAPGLQYSMDPTFPIYLIGGVWLTYYSYKRWCKSGDIA